MRTFTARLIAATATVGIVGCYGVDETATAPSVRDARARANAVAAHPRPKYLPRGLAMPDTGRYTLYPKPYAIGDPDPQPTTLENVVGLLGPREDHRVPPPQEGDYNDSWRGWRLLAGRGIYAAFDVAEDPIVSGGYVPPGWTLYAPTALPHGKSCLEVTNFHADLPPGAAIGVYDFCNAHYWIKLLALNDPLTRSYYVRTYTDPYDGTSRKRYVVSVYSDNPAAPDGSFDHWVATVYNFNTGAWDMLGQSTGTNSDPDHNGWIFHESRHVAGTDPFHPGTCYTLRSVTASMVEIRLSDGGFWLPDDFPGLYDQYFPGNDFESPHKCWLDTPLGGPWSYQTRPYYGWSVATPSRTY